MTKVAHICFVVVSLLIATAPAMAEGFDLSDRLADLEVRDGKVIVNSEAGPVALDGATFVQQLDDIQAERGRRGWLYQVLDITTPFGVVWVALGFLGQLLFSGRMIVQWLASEKEKRSVVPPIFWWMSLGGSTMLLIYFVWRIEIVGILGQAAPWGIYARNLWLIYRPRTLPS